MKNRRVLILDAAARLLGERGFAQTSVEDVIEAAELSGKSHFYHYFRSKDELGFQVLERQFERFADRGLAVLREPMIAPLDRLRLFVDAIVALQAERAGRGGSPFGALAAELADTHEGFRERLDSVFERWAAPLEALFVELRPHLVEDADPGRLAHFVIATLEGGMLLARVKRAQSVMDGVGAELWHYLESRLRERVVDPSTERSDR
ncbi:MAG TPA: TetR family transcriptional regulator [Gemmatimonadaceae bacterium]|nr:TetR family transcriptional regulator [Gemmatimonadaceae bacterium]